jgi:hypothetical protein
MCALYKYSCRKSTLFTVDLYTVKTVTSAFATAFIVEVRHGFVPTDARATKTGD